MEGSRGLLILWARTFIFIIELTLARWSTIVRPCETQLTHPYLLPNTEQVWAYYGQAGERRGHGAWSGHFIYIYLASTDLECPAYPNTGKL